MPLAVTEGQRGRVPVDIHIDILIDIGLLYRSTWIDPYRLIDI